MERWHSLKHVLYGLVAIVIARESEADAEIACRFYLCAQLEVLRLGEGSRCVDAVALEQPTSVGCPLHIVFACCGKGKVESRHKEAAHV